MTFLHFVFEQPLNHGLITLLVTFAELLREIALSPHVLFSRNVLLQGRWELSLLDTKIRQTRFSGSDRQTATFESLSRNDHSLALLQIFVQNKQTNAKSRISFSREAPLTVTTIFILKCLHVSSIFAVFIDIRSADGCLIKSLVRNEAFAMLVILLMFLNPSGSIIKHCWTAFQSTATASGLLFSRSKCV